MEESKSIPLMLSLKFPVLDALTQQNTYFDSRILVKFLKLKSFYRALVFFIVLFPFNSHDKIFLLSHFFESCLSSMRGNQSFSTQSFEVSILLSDERHFNDQMS